MAPKPTRIAFEGSTLNELFSIVLSKSGIDLRHYKLPTLRRRISRRMTSLGFASPAKYLGHVSKDKDEARVLAAECMVQVTSFFRDPHVFHALCKKVLPQLLKGRNSGDPMRIWVPGCATGEEAFSIALSLVECFPAAKHVPLQIFGTDVDEEALAVARRGKFPLKIEKDVPAELLAKYFKKTKSGYEISKSIRSLCTFAKQNLTSDPPFSHLDLISCRNVLIYINDAAQARILSMFHYGLNPDGYLLLGRSEAIGASFPELFDPVDKRANLYTRRPTAGRLHVTFPKAGAPVNGQVRNGQAVTLVPPGDSDFERQIDHALLAALQPSVVVVNEAYDVVQIRGDVSNVFRFPTGKMSFSLVKVAREDLVAPLRFAIDASRRGMQSVRRTLTVKSGRRELTMDFEVRPLIRPLFKERFFMVIFRQAAAVPAESKSGERRLAPAGRRQLRMVQQELEATRTYLQSIVEENERASQELRSANEEILSSNEELQSTNEELETAKEELESTNEELTTVNEELERRNEDLKKSFEELTLSRNELRLAQSVANLGSWLWSVRDNVVQWSDEMYRIYGLSPAIGPVTYETFLAHVHPDDVDMVKSEIEKGYRSGKFSFIHRIVRLDKSVRTLQARGEVERDASGAIVRLHGTGQDITDVLAVQERLRRTEQRFRLLVEEVSDYAIYLLDLDGNVVTWNIGAQRLKGYRADEIIGKHFSTFYTEEDRRRGLPEKGLQRAREDGRWVSEGWRVRKNGSHFWASVVITAMKDADGKYFGFSKITRDMTERKEAEEELRRAHDGLEKRVEERTAELKANEERLLQKTRDLQKAEKELKRYAAELKESNTSLIRTNGELEQFAYVASHDLQEPLRKVANFSDVLSRRLADRLDDDSRRLIDQILSSVGRMQQLIFDLLQFSRTARESDIRQAIDVGVEIRKALDNLPETSSAQVNVGEMPACVGNPLQMRQLFQNLIGNAIKFRGKETARVDVKAEHREGEWLFSVADNGIGIEPEFRERIFVIFQRLHTSKAYPGTGVGLAICKKIVESRGGRIWVDRNPGGGSIFYFTWPDV